VDSSPTKRFIIVHRSHSGIDEQFELAFGKRPSEELYFLKEDPDQMNNVAGDAKYAEVKVTLGRALDEWMKRTNDPRLDEKNDMWSEYDYFGGPAPMPVSEGK
jgi:hypothetical protein